jgi:hypothetical protein
MMICANFHRRGKYWRRSILLNIAVSRVRAFLGMDKNEYRQQEAYKQ